MEIRAKARRLQSRIGPLGMNVAMGDVFNQGRLAIYISNISEEGILVQGNNLWVPREGAVGPHLTFACHRHRPRVTFHGHERDGGTDVRT